MPVLTVRSVGVSYLVEGLDGLGDAAGPLLDAAGESFGTAMAPIGEPAGGAFLVDRKAMAWEGLKAWLVRRVNAQGFGYAEWVEDPLAPGEMSMLHIHDEPPGG